ncbi:hypothetical protein QNH47_19310 [Virgibacillus halodenitrificans]|nr:hypothetical protein [Virgibacillus halodenitrificans]WHX26253.1 hypothetical protein QNH47_19310 [Virgibacillus halodenitrificans]
MTTINVEVKQLFESALTNMDNKIETLNLAMFQQEINTIQVK